MPAATTTVHLPLLASAQIASPCDRRWDDMPGNERVRHCSACNLNVYNFAEMTALEAEAFLREHIPKGRVCGLLFRRADGTVLTKDCPVGVARWRRGAAWAVGRAAAAVAFLVGGVALATGRHQDARLRAQQPFRSVCEWLNPAVKALPANPVPIPAGGIACPPALRVPKTPALSHGASVS
ncbi:MAG: hypothetical protein AABZ53_12175 [Planctomycetota bacterium]